MIKTLFCSLLLCLSISKAEMFISAHSGGNLHLVLTNIDTEAFIELGFSQRISLEVNFKKNNLALQPEIEYTLLRWKDRRIGYNEFLLHSLSIPILFVIQSKRTLHAINFFIGPKLNLNLASSTKLNGESDFSPDTTTRLNLLGVGATLGINLVLDMGNLPSFVFDWRYQMDFTQTSKEPVIDAVLSGVVFTVGLKIGLSRDK